MMRSFSYYAAGKHPGHQAGAISDQAERTALYKKAQAVFHREVPAVILGGADDITAVNKRVKNFTPAIFGASRLSGVTVE